jgi:endonuclease III
MTPRTAASFFQRLERANPEPRTELEYRDAYTLLVAVILSAQATDVGVNKATRRLFEVADTPEKMVALGEDGLIQHIKTIGLFRNKAKAVIAMSRQLIDAHGGVVPDAREALEKLPGVGRKTANVVLGDAFGIPGITVDTHFGRVARRLGFTEETDPVKAEHAVGALFPKKDWVMLSHHLIWHGRRCCHAQKPACGACPVAAWCPSYGTGPTDAETAAKLLRIEGRA